MTTPVRERLTHEQQRVLDNLFVECGTPEGHRLHSYRKEVACSPCSWAWEVSPGCAPVAREGCGTADGWLAHRKRQEWPCVPCSEARELFEARRCGTYAGWMWHRRSGTGPCPGCLAARRSAHRDRKRNPTRDLLMAVGAGASLADADGRPVVHAPRRTHDARPFALLHDPAVHLPARDVRAVQRPESEEL